ncbi:MAG: hypothetical protein ACR2QO_16920 [Acidimicrobiales bacterium]
MTVKQTDRVQIQSFGNRGVELFNAIENQLRNLVVNTAEVNYEGRNAFDFKTACVNYSHDFAVACTGNMQQISQTITEATTYIATALGGAPIDLEPPTVVIDPPAVSADTSVETAEDGPLIELRGLVELSFGEIESSFDENLANFQALGADGWIGPEYDAALSEVNLLTTKATEEAALARTTIVGAINSQLQALGMGG